MNEQEIIMLLQKILDALGFIIGLIIGLGVTFIWLWSSRKQ